MLCRRCAALLQTRQFTSSGASSVFANLIYTKNQLHPSTDVPRRTATTWKRRMIKQEEIEKNVIQYGPDSLKKTDRVYVWGYAAAGALGVRRFMKPQKGQRPRSKQLTPHVLQFFPENRMKVSRVGCGYGFSVFLCKSESGAFVYGCGINTDSQLGYQEYPRKSGRLLDFLVEPARIELPLVSPDKTKLTSVACGRAHTIVVTDKEGVFSLGNNAHGQCGRPVVTDELYRGSQLINKVNIGENIREVYCGQDHSLFLTENGEVYSCGLGADGQTGLGHYGAEDKPTKLKGDIEGENIVSIASRSDTVLAVSENGDLFGWGNSEYGQLSVVNSDEMQINTPRHLNFKNIGKVKKAAAAGSMCAVLNENGEVFVWGFGILGKGPKLEDCEIPEKIPDTLFGCNEFNPEQKVVSLECGISHFAALTETQELYMWGKNKSACLGLGHKLDQYFPTKVQVPADVYNVSCGVDHTVVQCKTFV